MNLWINQRAQGLFIWDNGRLSLGLLISLVDFFRIEICSACSTFQYDLHYLLWDYLNFSTIRYFDLVWSSDETTTMYQIPYVYDLQPAPRQHEIMLITLAQGGEKLSTLSQRQRKMAPKTGSPRFWVWPFRSGWNTSNVSELQVIFLHTLVLSCPAKTHHKPFPYDLKT